MGNTTATLAALEDLGASIEQVGGEVDWSPAVRSSRTEWVLPFSMKAIRFGWGDRHAWPGGVRTRRTGYEVEHARGVRQLDRTALYRAVQRLFEQVDFLVTPALPTTAPAAVGSPESAEPALMTGWNTYMYPFNHTGHAAASVPSGFGVDGLPTGEQIVGPWYADRDVLQLAAALEQARPWAHLRPAG